MEGARRPFRLEIRGECTVSRPELRRTAEANAHHPFIAQTFKPHGRKLAIVGGGPLVVEDLPELRAWEGDIWAINFTAGWLNAQGIRATLFTVDPLPFETDAPEAILASVCHPSLFERFAGRLRTFHMLQTHSAEEGGICGGAFSSTCAAAVALRMGYADVSFFGCEGSYEAQDHVDRHEGREAELFVRAGGKDYRTCPPYIIQCEELMKLFVFDGVFHNRSRGLLKAMLENPDTWEVVAVSAAFKEHLESVNGYAGLYEEPYQPQVAA